MQQNADLNRRRILKVLASLGVTGPLAMDLAAQSRSRITTETLRSAAAIRGEEFSAERLKVIETALQRNLDQFQIVRDFMVDDSIEPAPIFISTRHAR